MHLKKLTFLLLIFFLIFCKISNYPVYSEATAEEKPVYIIPIKGVIDLGLSSFVERALEEAKSQEAKAVVFEIDTFGGRVDAAVDICKYISRLEPTPTIAYVTDQAWSAGALITFSCKSIIMSPGSSIGSAEPRKGGFGAQQQVTDEKTISALRAKFKAIAQENGHSPNLAQAMVDKDIEIKLVEVEDQPQILTEQQVQEKINEHGKRRVKVIRTISQKDKLLNLTAQEAKELNLAEELLSNLKEVLKFHNLEGSQVIETSPNWAEILVRFITHPVISSLLLTLGFLGILFELRMPGWGISGTLGVIFLALFFWGHYLVGLANWLEIFLFGAGVFLLALEIFVIPGFGIAGIAGIALIVVSLFLALIKHPFQFPRYELMRAFYTLSYSIIATFVIILLSLKFFPQTGLWRRLVLTSKETRKAGFRAAPKRLESYVGKTGKALTNLRPCGRAIFDEESIDVVTEGGFIEKDKIIQVIKVEGNRVVVKSVDKMIS